MSKRNLKKMTNPKLFNGSVMHVPNLCAVTIRFHIRKKKMAYREIGVSFVHAWITSVGGCCEVFCVASSKTTDSISSTTGRTEKSDFVTKTLYAKYIFKSQKMGYVVKSNAVIFSIVFSPSASLSPN